MLHRKGVKVFGLGWACLYVSCNLGEPEVYLQDYVGFVITLGMMKGPYSTTTCLKGNMSKKCVCVCMCVCVRVCVKRVVSVGFWRGFPSTNYEATGSVMILS